MKLLCFQFRKNLTINEEFDFFDEGKAGVNKVIQLHTMFHGANLTIKRSNDPHTPTHRKTAESIIIQKVRKYN